MERLRKLRESKNETQKSMAEFLGIDRTTYVKYETGASEPNFSTLSKLADYFSVSVDYLIGRDETKKIDPSEDGSMEKIMRDRPDIAKLMVDMSALNDEQVQDVYNYLKYIILPKADKGDE